MFTAIDYSNLGKSSFFTYSSPSKPPAMDVSIIPVRGNAGNANYITVLESDEDAVIPQYMNIDEEPDLLSQLDSDSKDIEESNEENKSQNQKKSIFSIGDDYINNFYIGSVTVVGLFILFRILQKTK